MTEVAPGTDGSFVQVNWGIIRGVELRVVVSGAPGTGKTTIAELLAHQFKVPILSLDAIKEALGDSLGENALFASSAAGPKCSAGVNPRSRRSVYVQEPQKLAIPSTAT
jgi:ATP-dependent protease Clp ATPase subunit